MNTAAACTSRGSRSASPAEHKNKLGRHRWVVGRSVSWLLRFKRLGLRYGRTRTTVRPPLLLGVSIFNLRRLVTRPEP